MAKRIIVSFVNLVSFMHCMINDYTYGSYGIDYYNYNYWEDYYGDNNGYPGTLYSVNFEKNIEWHNISSCRNSPNSDRSNGERLAGNCAFRFTMKYANSSVGKDYYMALAIGKNSLKTSGQYFAYYGVWGYTGFQPNGLDNGRQKLSLIYSSFDMSASVIDNQNCYSGADGSTNGVSCYVEYSYIEYDKLYYIRSVYEEHSRVFTGYFIDPYNERTIQIGSFRYSKTIEWQPRYAHGFIETYSLRHNTLTTCCDLDSVDIFVVCPFGIGITCSHGVVSEYGTTCVNDFSAVYSKPVNNFEIAINNDRYNVDGLYIHRGWRRDTRYIDDVM